MRRVGGKRSRRRKRECVCRWSRSEGDCFDVRKLQGGAMGSAVEGRRIIFSLSKRAFFVLSKGRKLCWDQAWPRRACESGDFNGQSWQLDKFVGLDSREPMWLGGGDGRLVAKLMCALLQLFESLAGRCSHSELGHGYRIRSQNLPSDCNITVTRYRASSQIRCH